MARTPTSTVPVCRVSSAPWRKGRDAPARTRTRASMRRVAGRLPGGASTSPRFTSSFSMPARLTATRPPGNATSALRPCCWTPRTRTVWPRGSTSSSSPGDRDPSTRVPVTTVPKPLIVKARSIGSLGRPSSARAPRPDRTSSSAALSASRPRPVEALTGTIGASASVLPSSAALTSVVTSCSHS